MEFCVLGRVVLFFPRLQKLTVLDQPTVDNGRVNMGRSVAVTVGFCLLAVGTSMELQWLFNGTLTALQRNLQRTSMSHKKGHKKNIILFWCGQFILKVDKDGGSGNVNKD